MSSENPIIIAYRNSRYNADIINLFIGDNSWKDFQTIVKELYMPSKTVTAETLKSLINDYKILEDKWDKYTDNGKNRAVRKFKIKEQYEKDLGYIQLQNPA